MLGEELSGFSSAFFPMIILPKDSISVDTVFFIVVQSGGI